MEVGGSLLDSLLPSSWRAGQGLCAESHGLSAEAQVYLLGLSGWHVKEQEAPGLPPRGLQCHWCAESLLPLGLDQAGAKDTTLLGPCQEDTSAHLGPHYSLMLSHGIPGEGGYCLALLPWHSESTENKRGSSLVLGSPPSRPHNSMHRA